MNKPTMSQKSRILHELDRVGGNTELWDELDELGKDGASLVIEHFLKGDDTSALNQMNHLLYADQKNNRPKQPA